MKYFINFINFVVFQSMLISDIRIKLYNKKLIILINITILIYISYIIFKLKKINIKVCICTIGKKENKYIREYIDYYKNYGIDKIFLYDNNNLDGEKFEEVINEYITQNFVEIKNWRGINKPQMMIYNDCFTKNYNKFEWLFFNDIDEYIYLRNYNNIKKFLNKPRFKKCENIQLNWLLHTDNNLIHYLNKSLLERFVEKDPFAEKRNLNKHSNGKSILKGHIPNIKITNFHCISDQLKTCNGFWKIRNNIQKDYKYYYINHYFSKSTEEFIDKLKKGDVYKGTILDKISRYFSYNEITLKKINYIEKELKLNLNYYRKKITQNKIKKKIT